MCLSAILLPILRTHIVCCFIHNGYISVLKIFYTFKILHEVVQTMCLHLIT